MLFYIDLCFNYMVAQEDELKRFSLSMEGLLDIVNETSQKVVTILEAVEPHADG